MSFPSMNLPHFIHRFLILALFSTCAAACKPVSPATLPPTPTPIPTVMPSPTFTPTLTASPTFFPTRKPLVLVFYGDSVLKVGDVNQAASEGFSFVDPLKASLAPEDQLIVSNHGGRRASWAYENLQENVLRFDPDVVTLWWGLNDLGGCPGIFDRATNSLLQYKLAAQIDDHVYYMRLQINAILRQGAAVFIMTPIPVLGQLPWTHFTPDYQLVWETDHHCEFNPALEQLAAAQRTLVDLSALDNRPVYLVDAWQVYKDNPNADKMYMDVVHPASHGAALIAAEWLRVFQTFNLR